MSDDSFHRRVSALVDRDLSHLLLADDGESGVGHRELMTKIKTAVVAYLDESSAWYHAPKALVRVRAWLAGLTRLQGPDGLFGGGANLASPPDSSFTVNDMAQVCALATSQAGGDKELWGLVATLRSMMVRITPALVAGGVHTPNHRWELASALARLDQSTPDPTVQRRVEEWLAEGVDVAADGLYSERSPNYAARVTNPSLIVLANHQHRPELLDIVHRNLHAHAALTDVDGFVETLHSRRQDQGKPFPSVPFLMQYRRFALLYGCVECASAASVAERSGEIEAVNALAEVLSEPDLGRRLRDHESGSTGGRQVVHSFPSAALVKIQQGRSLTTIYAGSDVPRAGRVGSGLACDPTFLRWRYGEVTLGSVRLSRSFFGLGPFRGTGLTALPPEQMTSRPERPRAGVYRLEERVAAAYYQPLGIEQRLVDGSYGLEHEGRFSAAMAFSQRDSTEVELTTELVVTTDADSVTIDAQFAGVETSYAFELCFRPGGALGGVEPLPAADCYELVSGFGTYRVGDDVVSFGPGQGAGPGRPPGYFPGEAYTFLGATDAVAGLRVYLTGHTPGRQSLVLRGSCG